MLNHCVGVALWTTDSNSEHDKQLLITMVEDDAILGINCYRYQLYC